MRILSSRSGLFCRWLTATTALAGVLPVLALTAPPARANPEGGAVVQGAATITQTNPKTVTVNQTTDKAVINWRGFSIGADETTRFNQPSSSSTTLNRVTGDQVSKILGTLSANGKVFLVNPNGIVFGAGSKIDVAALVASTADIKTENFMAGTLRFDIPGKAGAAIVNQGTITAADGGLVALVSPVLRNSGIIQARLGRVALASANGVTLDLYGDNLILFQAADTITQQMIGTDGKPVTTAVDNSGQIYADGGRVLMTANTAKGVVDNAINTTGLVSARAVEQHGGEIVLKGEDGGIVQVAGRLVASGTGTGQTGGKITAHGDGVTLADGASLDASGDAGGGKVTVGGWDSSTARMASGASIDASAKTIGNGGDVSVIAADTDVSGSIHAKSGENGGNGGSIETSGHFLRVANIRIDASARRGLAGQWLLDPYDLTVDADAASSISGSLNTGTNVSLLTTANGTSGPGTASSGDGDIRIASALSWTGSGDLSLSAYRNILIQAAVTHGGSGMLILNPDTANNGDGRVLTGADTVSLGSVTFTGSGGLRISGNDYTLIRNVDQLQAMGTTGYYALANNIDASATANWSGGDGWSNGVGFRPIGYYFIDDDNTSLQSYFMGTIDGLGNKISNLTINKQGGNDLGLVAVIGNTGLIQNLEIRDGSVSGNSFLGLIAGQNLGNIVNVRVDGEVEGDSYLGGMVGNNAGTVSYGASTANVTGQNDFVGGLVGLNDDSGIIRSSNAASTVKGASRVGGLVGQNMKIIQMSMASGTTTGKGVVGGLVGMNDWNGEISGSSASGTVGGTTSSNPNIHEIEVGGLVGSNIRGGRISTSYATANVYGNATGNNRLGGLVGWNGGAIAASYATGVVYGEGAGRHEVGGLVGWNGGTVSKSYATGRVAGSGGENALGGLVGSAGYERVGAEEPGTVADSFWNTETTRQSSSAGGTGLTTAQMNDPATFTNAGWDTSVWNLTAGSTPKLKTVNATNPTPPPASDDNPLMGLDAEGLYATILSNNWADTYSTNSYWLEVAEASGAYLSDAQKEADIMLKAWARYRNYSGQTLADKLYLDYMNQFTIGSTKITNDPDNPIWYGAYGSAASASEGQKTANVMIQAYRKFGNASADEIFAALLHPTVTLAGITNPQPFTNSPDNIVWRGIYGSDMQASEAQRDANLMANVRRNLYDNVNLLVSALRGGIISIDSLQWKALKDGWGTGTLYLSAVQKDALKIIQQQNAEDRAKEDAKDQADKDNRNIEQDRMIGIQDPIKRDSPYEVIGTSPIADGNQYGGNGQWESGQNESQDGWPYPSLQIGYEKDEDLIDKGADFAFGFGVGKVIKGNTFGLTGTLAVLEKVNSKLISDPANQQILDTIVDIGDMNIADNLGLALTMPKFALSGSETAQSLFNAGENPSFSPKAEAQNTLMLAFAVAALNGTVSIESLKSATVFEMTETSGLSQFLGGPKYEVSSKKARAIDVYPELFRSLVIS